MRHRNIPDNSRLFLFLVAGLFLSFSPTLATALPFSGLGQPYLTLNTDVYNIDIQKNGRFNVSLISGAEVFVNAFPMIWLDGDDKPSPLPVSGRSSARIEVRDRLGEGQGVALQKGPCTWVVRAYPGKPFFTAQVTYANTTDKPVRVKMLMPWCVGQSPGAGRVSLGPETSKATILSNGSGFGPSITMPELVTGQATSLWDCAIFNPTTRRSLITGFITTERALPTIHVARSEKAAESAFDTFQAQCIYDPPVEVPAGGTLDSEVFYAGIAEPNPFDGLERFTHALGVQSDVVANKPFLPHGWRAACTAEGQPATEQSLVKELNAAVTALRPYGWEYFEVGNGWQSSPDALEPDPSCFPQGMKWLAQQIHEKKMKAGIYVDPFVYAEKSALVAEHPDWFTTLGTEFDALAGPNARLLDPTVPAAYDHLRGIGRRVGQEWGYDVLVVGPSFRTVPFAKTYADPAKTRVEVLRMAMQALRDGLGEERHIIAPGPEAIVGTEAISVGVGEECAPIWRATGGGKPWSALEALRYGAHRYYFAPFLGAPDLGCAYLDPSDATRAKFAVTEQPALSKDESYTWLQATALLGGTLHPSKLYSELSKEDVYFLQRLTPVPSRPARPVDLFTDGLPNVWALPYSTSAGQWLIVGIFNWEQDKLNTIRLDLPALGLDPAAYYTVYDSWSNAYLGKANGTLNVQVRPGGVKILGFRRYAEHPMFVASDRHFTQGAMDHTAIEWSETQKTLSGKFNATADIDYTFTILCPPGYRPASVRIAGTAPTTELTEQVLTVRFHSGSAGLTEWQVQF